jgi:hypothetical protein
MLRCQGCGEGYYCSRQCQGEWLPTLTTFTRGLTVERQLGTGLKLAVITERYASLACHALRVSCLMIIGNAVGFNLPQTMISSARAPRSCSRQPLRTSS